MSLARKHQLIISFVIDFFSMNHSTPNNCYRWRCIGQAFFLSPAISISIHSNSINTSRGVEKQLADADKLCSVEAFSHHEAVGAERRVGFGCWTYRDGDGSRRQEGQSHGTRTGHYLTFPHLLFCLPASRVSCSACLSKKDETSLSFCSLITQNTGWIDAGNLNGPSQCERSCHPSQEINTSHANVLPKRNRLQINRNELKSKDNTTLWPNT